MGCRPLLFFDSGAGGLPYLSSSRQMLPRERYIYLADRANFPFGEKPVAVLQEAVARTLSLAIERFDPKLIVIACNTASVASLRTLRRRFSLPFVGVVPAVKPAAMEGGRMAVIATRQTSGGPYLQRLIEEFATGLQVVKVPVADLVDFVEYEYLTASEQEKLQAVRRVLEPLADKGIKAVVLGCTHFTLLEKEFRALLPQEVALIDSREGVSRRVVSLLERQADLCREPRREGELYLHGGEPDGERYRLFARAFGLRYCGTVEGTHS